MPRRGRRFRSFATRRSSRALETARGTYAGQSRATHIASRDPNLPSTRSPPEGVAEDDKAPVPQTTTQVGGPDLDSDRPAKVARLSPAAEHSHRPEESVPIPEDMQDLDSGPDDGEDVSIDSTPSTDELALHNLVPIETYENGDDVSEPTNELNEPLPPLNVTVNDESPVKVKRPKGWHLRKENRHLRQAVLQGSPIRSERQDSIDTQEASGYEPAAILKRLPGRRRAPHADPDIEADMRRQLELKIAYRAVVKALKPILAELSQRDQDNLEQDAHFHEGFDEHDVIMRELDSRLENRLSIVDRYFQEEEERRTRIYEAKKAIAKNRCEAKTEDLFDDYLARCKSEYMSIVRASQRSEDSDATTDEDFMATRLLHVHAGSEGRRRLRYIEHSRCGSLLENERSWNALEDRHQFRKSQQKCVPESLVSRPKGFAVYDGVLRASSLASLKLLSLIEAGHELERRKEVAARRISNAAATGLQALATAADSLPKPQRSDTKVVHHNPISPRNALTYAPQPTRQPQDVAGAFERPFEASRDHRIPPAEPQLQTYNYQASDDHRSYRYYDPVKPAEPPKLEPQSQHPPSEYARFRDALPQPQTQPKTPPVPKQSLEIKPRFEATTTAQRHRKAPTFDIIMHQPPERTSRDINILTRHDGGVPPTEIPSSPDDSQRESSHRRKSRPGPRAIYTSNGLSGTKTAPSILQPPHQSSPFNNNMGPPVAFPPNYVRDSGYPPHPLGPPAVREPGAQSSDVPGSSQAERPPAFGPIETTREHATEYTRYEPFRSVTSTSLVYGEHKYFPTEQRRSPPPPPAHSYPATPIPSAPAGSRVESWNAGSSWLAPKPRATSNPEQPPASQTLSRPFSPASRLPPYHETRPPYPVYGSSSAAPPPQPHSYHPHEATQPQYSERPSPRSPSMLFSRAPTSRAETFAYPPREYGPIDSRQPERRHTSDAGTSVPYRYHHHPPPPPPPPPATAAAAAAPVQYAAASPHSASRPPSSSQDPRDSTLTQSMQRHPGQRIGQQLLPSTLDPSRTDLPKNAPVSSTPQGPSPHRKQRSNSGSARSWHVRSTSHGPPPPPPPPPPVPPHHHPQYPHHHHHHHHQRSNSYLGPSVRPPDVPPRERHWEPSTPQARETHGVSERWPGFERREAQFPPAPPPPSLPAYTEYAPYVAAGPSESSGPGPGSGEGERQRGGGSRGGRRRRGSSLERRGSR